MCLFVQLCHETRRDMEALYDECCRAYKSAIDIGQQKHGARVVAVDMANLEEALRWNEEAVRTARFARSSPVGIAFISIGICKWAHTGVDSGRGQDRTLSTRNSHCSPQVFAREQDVSSCCGHFNVAVAQKRQVCQPVRVPALRVSVRQDLEARRKSLRELGVHENRIYTDHALTGTNREHPGLETRLSPPFARVICWSLQSWNVCPLRSRCAPLP